MSSKYCRSRNFFLSLELSNAISGKPPNSINSSRDAVLLNSRNSANDKGVILNDKFLPVSSAENSLDRSDAEDPVTINFIFSLRSYFVLIHFSQPFIFCTSSIKKYIFLLFLEYFLYADKTSSNNSIFKLLAKL